MTLEKDKEYLARPLIEGMVFIIEDNHVQISSPNTIFVNIMRFSPIAKDEILTLYKNILCNRKVHDRTAYFEQNGETVLF